MLPEKIKQQLNLALTTVKNNNLLRTIKTLDFIDAGHALDAQGKKQLVLATNNYLGLTFAPELIQAAHEALHFGTGSTGARLTTGCSSQLRELETELAKFKHTEAALFFNTGYMANVGVISALANEQDVIFSDELNHASIIDGARLSKAKIVVYRHSDMADLRRKIAAYSQHPGCLYIITDGVFSMDGDIANLPELVEIATEFQACLIVDDAHAVGVLGETGSGTAEFFGLQGKIPVQIGTLSKALASEGGYVAAEQVVIDYLVNTARAFIFSTACAPATGAIALAALRKLQQEPACLQQLQANAQFMYAALKAKGLPVMESQTPIIPILIGEAKLAMEFSEQLRERGIIVTAIRPPSVEVGKSRLRLTVNASHSREDLAWAVEVIAELYHNYLRGEVK